MVNGIALLSMYTKQTKNLSYIQQGTHILFTLGFMNNQLFYFVFFRFAASILNRKKYIYISACRETRTCIKREPVFFRIYGQDQEEGKGRNSVPPQPSGQLFQIHGSKFKLDPVCNLGQASVLSIAHGVFFLGVGKDSFNGFFPLLV